MEARRLSVTYFITYAAINSMKRQTEQMTVAVDDDSSHIVITGLDPNSEYTVSMFAADWDGNNRGPSRSVTVHRGLCEYWGSNNNVRLVFSLDCMLH